MPELQRVVSVLADGRLNHNIMRNAIVLLGAAIESRGLRHVILDSNDRDFPRELLRWAGDPGTAIYLGHRFYDLGLVYSDAGGAVRRNLFEVLDRPVFAMVQDHPFARFMWPRIENASLTTRFVAPTPEFQAEAQFINPRLAHFHEVSPVVTEPDVPDSELRPLADRPIDIFMSCSIHSTSPSLEQLRQHYAAAASPMTGVIDEVYERAISERDRPIMALFLEAYRDCFDKPLVLETPMSKADTAVMLVLSCIDLRVRLDRRLKAIRSMARLDPGLKIVVTINPAARGLAPELNGRANVELIGGVTAARAREIFLNARFAVNVTPTYVSCVTERISNAMALGCCVVSDRNRHLAQTFRDGEEIFFMEDCDLASVQGSFRGDLGQAQAAATRARLKARKEFAVSKLADDLIAVMGATL